MANYDLNEALKAEKSANKTSASSNAITLDDLTRVKILSPGRKVLKRFISNKLAIVGFVTLAIIFFFAFIVPLFYPYGQTQVFYTYKSQNIVYGSVTPSISYTGYVVDPDVEINTNTNSYMTTFIKEMENSNSKSLLKLGEDEAVYSIEKLGDQVFSLGKFNTQEVAKFGSNVVEIATYDQISRKITYNANPEGKDFENEVKKIKGTSGEFSVGGKTYTYVKGAGKSFAISGVVSDFIYASEKYDSQFEKLAMENEDFMYKGSRYVVFTNDSGSSRCFKVKDLKTAKVFSTFRVDTFDNHSIDNTFMALALTNSYNGKKFTYNGEDYSVNSRKILDSKGNEFGEFTTMIVRRKNGDDSMEYGLKCALVEEIEKMNASMDLESKITYRIPLQKEDGSFDYDEKGNLKYGDSELRIIQKAVGGSNAISYQIDCNQITFVIDRFASPSLSHLLGTDGDGFDVLSRIMYGGRISLMVGFVVVFIEIILGVIMGGIAGFYGGWVDNLIMRLADIFYCLPSMPIMIILGSMMDAVRMDVYTRLYVMMAALGIMGWAGTARLVRGQILSFREQEFMIAAEATGIKTKTRIFKHLVPNVMPQLIVSATMGMGGTILTESTLSFLGLGVKHPLATWGTMINSVSSASAMAHYAYIWIPVGLLICITVVAFNFVGDGLRDAYDPKSKR